MMETVADIEKAFLIEYITNRKKLNQIPLVKRYTGNIEYYRFQPGTF